MKGKIIREIDEFLQSNAEAKQFIVTGLGFNYCTLFVTTKNTTGKTFVDNMANCSIDKIKDVDRRDDDYALVITDHKDKDYLVLDAKYITSEA